VRHWRRWCLSWQGGAVLALGLRPLRGRAGVVHYAKAVAQAVPREMREQGAQGESVHHRPGLHADLGVGQEAGGGARVVASPCWM
jgi:hypothetical protein